MTSRSISDALTTCQPWVVLFYSIGTTFDQTEPSRSATERSGVRFRNYLIGAFLIIKIFDYEDEMTLFFFFGISSSFSLKIVLKMYWLDFPLLNSLFTV